MLLSSINFRFEKETFPSCQISLRLHWSFANFFRSAKWLIKRWDIRSRRQRTCQLVELFSFLPDYCSMNGQEKKSKTQKMRFICHPLSCDLNHRLWPQAFVASMGSWAAEITQIFFPLFELARPLFDSHLWLTRVGWYNDLECPRCSGMQSLGCLEALSNIIVGLWMEIWVISRRSWRFLWDISERWLKAFWGFLKLNLFSVLN